MDDPMAELRNLQETEGIGNYHNQFEAIRMRINLPESDLVSVYLADLRNDTQMNVKMFQPQTVQRFAVGKLYEAVHSKQPSQCTARAANYGIPSKVMVPEFDGKIELNMGELQPNGLNSDTSDQLDEMVEPDIDIGDVFPLIESQEGIFPLKLEMRNSVFGAYELFDEISRPSVECVLIAEVAGGNMLMVPSSRESFVHYGIVDKFVFDPGGGIQKVIAMEYVGILFGYEHLGGFRVVNDRGVVINACNVCNELLELEMFVFDTGGQLGTETNVQIMESIVDFIFITLTISDLGLENAEMISAEMGGLLLGDESVVFTVFDPGGNCVWLNICYKDDFSYQLKLLPIHSEPGGCLLVVYVLQLMSLACSDILD